MENTKRILGEIPPEHRAKAPHFPGLLRSDRGGRHSVDHHNPLSSLTEPAEHAKRNGYVQPSGFAYPLFVWFGPNHTNP